ncbi:MAG: uncharacterized protein A8A55_1969 [Amphiamblys sp. WSBS2006]|nr:MAG: uncharacterized protein A8A55_1969 [Amphiamblys sp. WSBS2006]
MDDRHVTERKKREKQKRDEHVHGIKQKTIEKLLKRPERKKTKEKEAAREEKKHRYKYVDSKKETYLLIKKTSD